VKPSAASQSGLATTFACAADAVRARFACRAVAVAYSGGLDSAVLLRLAAAYCARHALPLYAFHIHHGLSPHADAWLAHCAAAAQQLGVSFEARRVTLARDGQGTEGSARSARYAALGALCVAHGCQLLLTAHHLDDQAETVLLQLLRGAGPAGLSGMDAYNVAARLLGSDTVVMARPLLAVGRAALEAFAAEHGLDWVEDESNADPRHARNALRHGAMPALGAAFPGYQERIARAAAHVQAAQRLLDELAAQDLAACACAGMLDCAKLRALGTDRQNNVLRHWFRVHGLALPSTAWLDEMRVQALEAADDAQLLVTHPDCHVRRYRDRLALTPRLGPAPEPVRFRWRQETVLAFPAFDGLLHFDPAPRGLDPAWLAQADLQLGLRAGGERVKLAPNRPTRSLKQHFQTLDVPPWERERLPVVQRGATLLYAAGVGMDCHHLTGQPGIVLRWEARAPATL
jgi:tRNA(Ile)-lysidine synthase